MKTPPRADARGGILYVLLAEVSHSSESRSRNAWI